MAIIYAKEEDDSSEAFFNATGLDASRGVCIVADSGKKAVFVDGRYTLAAHRVVNRSFTIIDYTYANIREWIRANIAPQEAIRYDWDIYTVSGIKRLQEPGYRFVGADFGEAKRDYNGFIEKLDIGLVGQSYQEKLARISHIFEHGDCLLLTDSASICWLFNIRGRADPYSLSINACAMVYKDGRAKVFVADRGQEIITPGARRENFAPGVRSAICSPNICETGIDILPLNALTREILAAKTIIADPDKLSCRLASYRDDYIYRTNPCLAAKAIKNAVELDNLRKIHIYDSVAVIKFLDWLETSTGDVTEVEAANKLQEFRRAIPGYIGDSFECISAADEHAAEIHFRTTAETDKTIKGMYLCDSGGQYYGGTTDVTRTVCLCQPTEEQIDRYTRVLMGHIDIFLSDPNADDLDAKARRYLREIGLDYAHGTGHGVGYMSHVHESPAGIYRQKSADFSPGMVLSNEPGYYKPGEYGIRIENVMYVDSTGHFKPLTLVPYCSRLINPHMLSDQQKRWLTAYYDDIQTHLSPLMPSLKLSSYSWAS